MTLATDLGVFDLEVLSDQCGGLAPPVVSGRHGHWVLARVALSAPGAAGAVESNELPGERVLDRIQSAHRRHPARHWRRVIVNLMNDVVMKSLARLFVVFQARHERTLGRPRPVRERIRDFGAGPPRAATSGGRTRLDCGSHPLTGGRTC